MKNTTRLEKDYLEKEGIKIPKGATMVLITDGEKYYFGYKKVDPEKIKDRNLIIVFDHFKIIETIPEFLKSKYTKVNINIPGFDNGILSNSKKSPPENK